MSSTADQPWIVEVTPPAVRNLRQVPARYRDALVEFIYGGLAESPKRRGNPLRPPLERLWSARRDDFRVLYRLDEDSRTLCVVRVSHRGLAYRVVTSQ